MRQMAAVEPICRYPHRFGFSLPLPRALRLHPYHRDGVNRRNRPADPLVAHTSPVCPADASSRLSLLFDLETGSTYRSALQLLWAPFQNRSHSIGTTRCGPPWPDASDTEIPVPTTTQQETGPLPFGSEPSCRRRRLYQGIGRYRSGILETSVSPWACFHRAIPSGAPGAYSKVCIQLRYEGGCREKEHCHSVHYLHCPCHRDLGNLYQPVAFGANCTGAASCNSCNSCCARFSTKPLRL